MAKKAKPKNKKVSQRWKKYKVQGDKLDKGASCQRCGPGTFLAQHSNRQTCGACGYTIFQDKK
ncbi:30S ribosomal protein S27ae [Candidatus Woesearchaeota archaeon]|nr:30S ribosomal protein S27ae [Candidatus Woesearchaeota archaeon]